MQQEFKLFLRKIIVFTIIIAIAQYIGSTLLPIKFVSNSWPFLLLFFLAFNIIMHRYLLISTEGKPKKFIFSFLLFTTIKILLYLGVILVYVLLNQPDAVAFIAVFFVNYFLYTIFEISAVLKILNRAKG